MATDRICVSDGGSATSTSALIFNVKWEREPLEFDFAFAPILAKDSYLGKTAFMSGLCQDEDYQKCLRLLSSTKVSQPQLLMVLNL